MRITSTGNLGIGTATVAAGNAVAVFGGNLLVGTTGNGVKFADGSYQSTAYTGAVAVSGTLVKISILSSGTSFASQATTTKMYVEVVGGGGGAGTPNGGAGAGGGAGGYAAKYFTGLTGGASYSYTIGPGGAGGASPASTGSAGTNSTFVASGITVTGGGGSGGGQTGGGSASGGAGGTATNGDINLTGQNGSSAIQYGTGGITAVGPGGYQMLGGSGGNGNGGTTTGGAGVSGVIRVWEYT
jgi:hypothetical protein